MLITEREVASIMNVSVSVVRKWRWKNHPPSFFKIGKSIRYEEKDIYALKQKMRVER
jgi:predicted DNA-binding transcriptional regulator AlpA